MALDKVIDSGKLNTGLVDTAATIGRFLKNVFGLSSNPALNWYQDPQPAYYQGQLVGYASGFAKDLFDLINAHESDPSGGGGSSAADVSGGFSKAAAGSFLLADDLSSGNYTITHNLGDAPDLIVLYSPDIGITASNGGSGTGVIVAVFMNASLGLTGTLIRRISEGSPIANPNVVTGSTRGVTSVTSSQFVVSCDGSASVPFMLAGGYRYYWFAGKLQPV